MKRNSRLSGAAAALALLIILPQLASAKAPFPYDTQWGPDSYTTPSDWLSFRAAAGAGTIGVRPEIGTATIMIGTAIDLGATLHLGHAVSIPAELRLRSGSVKTSDLRSSWLSYDSTATMLGTGLRFAFLGNERYEVGGTARFGVAFLGNDASQRDIGYSWSTNGPYVGAGLDLAVFPFRGFRSLELGLGFNADAAFVSTDPAEQFKWETEPDSRTDLFTALMFRAAWHL